MVTRGLCTPELQRFVLTHPVFSDEFFHTLEPVDQPLEVLRILQTQDRWPQTARLDAIVETALLRCRPFREVLSPSAYTPPMFARYLPGDAYGPHVDAVMGGNPPRA